MKKILLIGAAVALAILVFVTTLPSPANNDIPGNQSRVCFQQSCFQVELAVTPEQLSYGLMNRAHLDQDKGMLFIFQEDEIYPFWMKNTLIPLDMIWIDSQGKAVFIKENAQPCSPVECPLIRPTAQARYVLEVNAGTVERIGLSVGDSLEILI